MRKISITLILLLAFNIIIGQSKENNIVGTWKGEIKSALGTIDISIVIKKEEKKHKGWLTSKASGINNAMLQEINSSADSLTFKFNLAQAHFSGTRTKSGFKGIWTQRNTNVSLELFKPQYFNSSSTIKNRAQTPVKPFPYNSEDIQFTNTKDSISLAGTITIPKGEGPFPAAILLSVAGPNDRDQTHSMGHKPFMVLADYLTQRGFVVLRYDDRGVGNSEGTIYDADFNDFTYDALAAFDYLKSRKEIDPQKIGYIGNSEGTVLGPMAANQNNNIAFNILLGGVGKPLSILTKDRLEKMKSFFNLKEKERDEVIKYLTQVSGILKKESSNEKAANRIDQLKANHTFDKKGFPNRLFFMPEEKEKRIALFVTPWYRSQATYNPDACLSQLKCPVLAITGGLDPFQSPDLNLPAIHQALIKAGNQDITIVKIPKINHVMQTATTGLITEYPLLQESFSPKVMQIIENWLSIRFQE